MYMKCSKIVHPSSMNAVFASMLNGTKLSERECVLIGNTDVDCDENDSLLGLVEDQVSRVLENRHSYKAILTMEDLRIRYKEWIAVETYTNSSFEDFIEHEIDCCAIQIIQHPDPESWNPMLQSKT